MKRRNRKKNTRHDAHWVPVRFVGVMTILATMALAYVWLSCRCQSLGQELKVLEQQQAELVRKQGEEQFKWTRMKAPQHLERALAEHNLAMVWPSNRQVVRIHATGVSAGGELGRDPRLAKLDGSTLR